MIYNGSKHLSRLTTAKTPDFNPSLDGSLDRQNTHGPLQADFVRLLHPFERLQTRYHNKLILFNESVDAKSIYCFRTVIKMLQLAEKNRSQRKFPFPDSFSCSTERMGAELKPSLRRRKAPKFSEPVNFSTIFGFDDALYYFWSFLLSFMGSLSALGRAWVAR